MIGMTLQEWDVVASWFAGIATLLAVVLALFLDQLKAWWRQAKLVVSHKGDDNGDRRYVPPPFAGGDKSREELWLRLRVTNQARTPARGVQLRLLTIKKTTAPLENRPGWFFKVSHLQAITAPSLYRDFAQHFDIAYVKHEFGGETGTVGFYLAIVPPDLRPVWQEDKDRIERTEHYNLLDVGSEYLIRVALLCENAKLVYRTLKISAKVDSRFQSKTELGADQLRDLVCLDVMEADDHS